MVKPNVAVPHMISRAKSGSSVVATAEAIFVEEAITVIEM